MVPRRSSTIGTTLTQDKFLAEIRLTIPRAGSRVVDKISTDPIAMAKPFPLNPRNPERICWGCDQYCPPDAMRCGNGSERTQHPVELFGEGWHDWGLAAADKADKDENQP